MNGTLLRFEVAQGCMQLLASQTFHESWKTLGITPEEYDICRSPVLWHNEHRTAMRKVLDAFAIGAMDVTGVPRFELPAEYLAAIVATYVHPNNMQAACRIFENIRPAAEIAGATVDAGMVDPAQLFALVCMLHDAKSAADVRDAFEKKAGAAFRRNQTPLPEGQPARK